MSEVVLFRAMLIFNLGASNVFVDGGYREIEVVGLLEGKFDGHCGSVLKIQLLI